MYAGTVGSCVKILGHSGGRRAAFETIAIDLMRRPFFAMRCDYSDAGGCFDLGVPFLHVSGSGLCSNLGS